jgi:RIO kinase 1
VSALEPFIDEGWIADVLYEVKSGKEATVFCCRGGERSPVPLIAAKVYRPIESRRFRNDGMYAEGRVHMAREGRVRRAVKSKSAFGRQVQYGTWLWQEWEALRLLHGAGAAVPQPLAVGERAILMPFLGDEDGPAPMLHEVRLERDVAARIVDDLLRDVELMLDLDCVHGDLSPYNIMHHGERAIIIDFPQAVDPRLNHSGRSLLTRDVENLCTWARRHGVERPAGKIAARLWSRFMLGEIG